MLFSKKRLISLCVSSFCVAPVLASGYHFGTQSVTSQSTANASSAEAADASTLFYNPAGLTKLSGTNFSGNINLIAPSVEYDNAKAYYFNRNPASNDVELLANQITKGSKGKPASTSGKITENLVIAPHLYASHELNDKVTVGLGVYIPFASGTEYQEDSVLRYNINRTKLTSIDINPTVAFKINNNHSIAAGLTAQYSKAELRQYANFAGTKLPNGIADGFADVEGDDWGLGYTLGYLWDVNDNVRLGASYRSKVEHNLKGTAKWKLDNNLPAAVQQGLYQQIAKMGYVPDEKVSVKITTPESLSVHGMVKLDDKWTAFGDITWTRHSRFNEADIKYQIPKVVPNVTGKAQANCLPKTDCKLVASDKTTLKPNWKDTVKVGVGAAYQYNDKLQLRGGIAYDQSPVRSANDRLTTMPDNDRIWFSLGAKYDINNNSSINVGYSYIHIKDSKVNANGWCGSSNRFAKNCVSSRTNGSADYKSNAHILGIQYNYKF